MKEELKQRFYEEQVPTLLNQMTRIADALERHVELMEAGQVVEAKQLDVENTNRDEQLQERRERLKTQLQKLGELDQMARELRSKLEQKRAAEAAGATNPSVEETAKADNPGDEDEVVPEPSVRGDN